jgi:hypothetical protein
MRIFPSVPAAIVGGAVGMPLLLYGSTFIERTLASQWLLLPWILIVFVVPFLVSTGDLKYLFKSWRQSGLYSLSVKREDFALFYIPAWSRALVWFVSGVASYLLLRAVGIEL